MEKTACTNVANTAWTRRIVIQQMVPVSHVLMDLKEKSAIKVCRAYIVSSPGLKAQVSFSDSLLSVVCLSVCLSVCKIFFFLRLLLKNYQTWHKASLGEGNSSLFK